MKNPSIDSFILKTQNLSRSAILSSSKDFTYSQLLADTDSLSVFFINNGIKKSEQVAIIYNNSIQFIKIIISLWKINAVPIVLNTRLTELELNDQIKFAECRKVITDPEIKLNKDFLNAEILYIPENLNQTDSISSNIQSGNTALIIFTSGSSGKPKAVVHTFESLYQSALISNQILDQLFESRWLASLPFYHIGGFSILTRSLLFSCSIVLPDSLKTESIAESFVRFSPTHCSLVPTQLKRLIESGIRPDKELTKVLIGGGAITKNQTEEALKNNWPIFKVYGSTETASFVAAVDTNEIKMKSESVGKIIEPNEIKIVDENRKICETMKSGEILIKSPALFKGYINNKSETKNNLIDDWYYTGDIGRLDKDGYLFLDARKTDLIISGGENINPKEIEEILLTHPEISDAIVFPIDDDEWGQIPIALIVKKNISALLNSESLKDFLKNFLAGYKIPHKIFFEETIKRNELGKIDRNLFKEKYQTL